MNRPLTLIGFSGCGKSHLARRLAAAHGYRNIECDHLIEEKLEPSLPDVPAGTVRVAAWLGQPYDLGFPGRQQRYFFAEQEVLGEVTNELESVPPSVPTVIDTTGSVIYIDHGLLERLRVISTIVYLKISADDEQAMFEQYLSDPKPVVWQNIFQPQPDEPPADALRRCYPLLIAQRSGLYESLADVVVPVPYQTRGDFLPEEMLKRVEQFRTS